MEREREREKNDVVTYWHWNDGGSQQSSKSTTWYQYHDVDTPPVARQSTSAIQISAQYKQLKNGIPRNDINRFESNPRWLFTGHLIHQLISGRF